MNIIFKGVDGSVAIMTLADGANKEEAIKKFRDSHPNEYLEHFEIHSGKFPSSREFRDAWTVDNKQNIVVDKAKAMDIHMSRIRNSRDAQLELLDKEHLRYLGNAEKLAVIEEQKQVLRDLPSKVKGLEWPDYLEQRRRGR